jgi:hypothetical protein
MRWSSELKLKKTALWVDPEYDDSTGYQATRRQETSVRMENIIHINRKVANICPLILIFFFQCHHMSLMDFVVSPAGCG